MRTLPLVLLLGACWEPKETGPTGMVGTLTASDGTPLAGVTVESVEASQKTGPDGHFAVSYKEPSRYVHFQRGGAWYRRLYRTDDEGQVVTLRMPAMDATPVTCALDDACELVIAWELEPGFTATATLPCTPGQPVALQEHPAAAPQLACRDGREAVWYAHDGQIAVRPPPWTASVEVRGPEETPPRGCEVRIGGAPAEREGNAWTARSWDPVQAAVICDDRPAIPTTLTRERPSATVDWAPDGPVLDLEAAAPSAHAVTLAATGPAGETWRITLRDRGDGTFDLPPLEPGTYRVRVDTEAEPPPAEPGPLVLTPVAPSEGATHGLAGTWTLETDLPAGTVTVDPR